MKRCFITAAVALFLLNLLTAPAFTADNGQVTITRGKIVEHLKERLRLSAAVMERMDRQEQAQFLNRKKAELQRIARRVFPDTLTARSQSVLEEILATNENISELDANYNRLEIEKWLREVKMNFAWVKIFEPPPENRQKQLRENLSTFTEGVKAGMKKHLSDFFSEKEITETLNKVVEETFMPKIASPLTYYFKVPASDEEIKQLLRQFEERLQESKVRVQTRLAGVRDFKDPNQREKIVKFEKKRILIQISSRSFLALGKVTEDPDMAKFDYTSLDPQYMEIAKRLRKLRKTLREERNRREEKQRERKRKVREWQSTAEQLTSSTLENLTEKNYIPKSPDTNNVSDPQSIKIHSSSKVSGKAGPQDMQASADSNSNNAIYIIVSLICGVILVLFAIVVKIKTALKKRS